MSSPTPNITVSVDLTNPGQFFACCGLLELADRLWPGAEGWFDQQMFNIQGHSNECNLTTLLTKLSTTKVAQLDTSDNSASPLVLEAFGGLRLDWWKKGETAKRQPIDIGTTKPLMTWSGSQRGPRIFRLFQETLSNVNIADPFNQPIAVCDPQASRPDKAIAPFYFDSRRDGTSQDIGFSPDENDVSVECYPTVEILALIGIQRFRPRIDDNTDPRSFIYTAWSVQLPAVVAAFAAKSAIPIAAIGSYRFAKTSRGGEYLSMFSRAKRERSTDVHTQA